MQHRLFSLKGRLNRKPYWYITIGLYVVALVCGILFASAGSALSVFAIPLIVIAFVIGLSVGVRRLHDRNKSGWWMLLYYVFPALTEVVAKTTGLAILYLPAFALYLWAFIELGFLRGTDGSNDYGPDPISDDLDAIIRSDNDLSA